MQKILLVENDVELGHVIKLHLEEELRVYWAKSIPRAITMLDEPNIQMVILDVMMPSEGRWSLQETGHGCRTGLLLLEEFILPRKIRTIVYTAVSSPHLDDCKTLMQAHPEIIYNVLSKAEVSARDLVREVCDCLSGPGGGDESD